MKTRIRNTWKSLLSLLQLWILIPIVRFRKWIILSLIRFRAKLRMTSLRFAIRDADKNKDETGRKNMVVFNTNSGHYEPIQKRLLKQAAKAGKNKSNKAMTAGRKKFMQKSKPRVIDTDRAKQIEEKSLYVTR